MPPMSEERALVDLVATERMQGRRVLVCITHTGTRDVTGRIDDLHTRHGFSSICHPRLLQTGLDLIAFPTICWYETETHPHPLAGLVDRWAVRHPLRARSDRDPRPSLRIFCSHPAQKRQGMISVLLNPFRCGDACMPWRGIGFTSRKEANAASVSEAVGIAPNGDQPDHRRICPYSEHNDRDR